MVCQVSIMYYLATKSIIKLLYDRNDLLRYAVVFQNFPHYLMVYTVEGVFKIYTIHAERRLSFDCLLYLFWEWESGLHRNTLVWILLARLLRFRLLLFLFFLIWHYIGFYFILIRVWYLSSCRKEIGLLSLAALREVFFASHLVFVLHSIFC